VAARRGAAPGTGFAFPSNLVTDIAGQIVNHCTVVNPPRGARGQRGQCAGRRRSTARRRHRRGHTRRAGRHRGTLNPGSVVTCLGHTPIRTYADLTKALATPQPGHPVPVTVTEPATGSTRTLTVTLDSYPAADTLPRDIAHPKPTPGEPPTERCFAGAPRVVPRPRPCADLRRARVRGSVWLVYPVAG
jgi:putative serine protease PepD